MKKILITDYKKQNEKVRECDFIRTQTEYPKGEKKLVEGYLVDFNDEMKALVEDENFFEYHNLKVGDHDVSLPVYKIKDQS